eukprot:GAHX01001549.1.p1 GENE.GAHX01001549.1~~GAHX01001549.1.p1  ORF type:complete len:227 (+),score=40.36 GAHX01001549.1:47-727(+)
MSIKNTTGYVLIILFLQFYINAHKAFQVKQEFSLFNEDTITKEILDQGHNQDCLKFATSSLLQYKHQLLGIEFPNDFEAEKLIKNCDICGQHGDLIIERIFEYLRTYINSKTNRPYFKTLKFKTVYVDNDGDNKELEEDLVEYKMAIAEIKIGKSFAKLTKENYYFDDLSPEGSLSHIVLITGFKEGYLKLQNSWGNRWGNGGLANILVSNLLVRKLIFVDFEIDR